MYGSQGGPNIGRGTGTMSIDSSHNNYRDELSDEESEASHANKK